MVAERRTLLYYLCDYVSCGLAVASKRDPAVAFVVYVWLFFFMFTQRGQWRKLIHAPVMILGLVITTSWFVVVYLTHGQAV